MNYKKLSPKNRKVLTSNKESPCQSLARDNCSEKVNSQRGELSLGATFAISRVVKKLRELRSCMLESQAFQGRVSPGKPLQAQDCNPEWMHPGSKSKLKIN